MRRRTIRFLAVALTVAMLVCQAGLAGGNAGAEGETSENLPGGGYLRN